MRAQKISAAKAARSFSEILNRVKYRGESFVVERNREPICRTEPVARRKSLTAASLPNSGPVYRVPTIVLQMTLRKSTDSFVSCLVRHGNGNLACVDGCCFDTSVLLVAEGGQLPPDMISKPNAEARLSMSAITVSELLHGFHCAKTRSQRLSRERFLTALLAELEILPFDLLAAREHARIWADLAERGEIIGPYEPIIAATALAYRAPVATLDDSEFRKVRGLKVRALRLRQPSEGSAR